MPTSSSVLAREDIQLHFPRQWKIEMTRRHFSPHTTHTTAAAAAAERAVNVTYSTKQRN